MGGRERIVIANCGGFWGDDPTAAKRQVEGGPIDYLVMDYLAEVTMAILQKQRAKRPDAGYAHHFLAQLRDVLPACVERGVKIISNAGGVNPFRCRDEVELLAAELGLSESVVAGVVVGDDIYGELGRLEAEGEALSHMDSGRPFGDIRDRVLAANVYLGAEPVAKALELGANVVITGRAADAAVTLAPMMYEFGWSPTDWDKVAAGVVAGHLIECGTQVTGGNFTDWRDVRSFDRMGYPLVEAHADGTFVVTKHPGTGGLVNVHTVSEQLVYEMGSPRYMTPDCVARFDSVRLEPDGPDRVRVSGVRGEPAPARLKASVLFDGGYRAFGRLMISGPDALRKARLVEDIFWASAGGREAYRDAVTQYIGWDSCRPSEKDGEPPEVLLQFAVRDPDPVRIRERFSSQIAAKVLGTVPAITYLSDQGFPRPRSVVGHWPALVDRARVPVRVVVTDREESIAPLDPDRHPATPFEPEPVALPPVPRTGRQVRVSLRRLCLARSGDKGDTCNIGVIARSPAIFGWMRESLTADVVKDHFGEVCRGPVHRHELANVLALNFLLEQSLGGGGTLSLQLDAQGKTFGQHLLTVEVEVDESLLADAR